LTRWVSKSTCANDTPDQSIVDEPVMTAIIEPPFCHAMQIPP
jgi:hypothetical protein